MTRPPLAFCAAAVLLAACGPNLKKLELRQANDALARKDYVVAAEHFHRACELDPADAEVCTQAKRVAERAVNESTDDAKEAIDAGRYAEALAHLNKARALDRNNKVGPLLDEVGGKLAGLCESHPTTTAAQAIRLVRCLEGNRSSVNRPSYAARIDAGRTRAGEVVGALAQASAEQKLTGTAYAQYGVAQCLSGDPRFEQPKHTEYGRFYERVNVPTTLHTQLPWSAPRIDPIKHCQELAQQRPLLNCQGGSGTNALVADVRVSVAPVAHTVRSEPREIEYVDHIETYPNPEWQPLVSEYERQRRLANSEARNADRAAARCETASSAWRRANSCLRCMENDRREAACNDADAARNAKNRQESEVRRLKSELDSTPRTLEREVRDIFRYVERHHRYSQAYQLTGSTTFYARVVPARDEGNVEFNVVEHVGFAKANLQAQPLVVPSQDQYRRTITEHAARFGHEMVESELQARSQALLNACGANDGSGRAIECWLEGKALVSPDPMAAYTELLSDEVGNVYPPAGCR